MYAGANVKYSWPKMRVTFSCIVCAKYTKSRSADAKPSKPIDLCATDLFEMKDNHYLFPVVKHTRPLQVSQVQIVP